MERVAAGVVVPAIRRESLATLERHFIAREIYERDDVAARQAKIARMVSSEVVPRLLRLHTEIVTDAPPVEALIEALAPSSADVTALAEIVLGTDLQAAAAYVMVLRDRGLSVDVLFLELLEPTARHLGEMWHNDECDFVDVTLGVARLQKLLAIFNETHDEPALETRRHVLMATMPGEQHHFGARMVARFLSAAGWQVRTELPRTVEEVVAAARSNWFAVAGLTGLLPVSRTPGLGVMMGPEVIHAASQVRA